MSAYLVKSMVGIGPIRVIAFPEKKEAAAEWNKLAILERERYIRDGLVAEVIYATTPSSLARLPEFKRCDQLPIRYANETELAIDSREKCEELMGVRFHQPAGDFVAPASYTEPTPTDQEVREQMRARCVALGEAWLANPSGPAVLGYVAWTAPIAWMFEDLRQGEERFRYELGVNQIYGRFKHPREVMKQLSRLSRSSRHDATPP
jgi:hypothetical protein